MPGPVRILAIRELASFFLSPLAWVVLALFLLFHGYLLHVTLTATDGDVEATLRSLLGGAGFWLSLFLLAPALTMRQFAEERRTGTLETLLTAPVGDAQVVAGKFLGAFLFYALLWTAWLALPALILLLGGSPDLGALAARLAGVLLAGAAFLAAGLFASSLTSSQAIAASTSAVLLILLSLLSFAARWLPEGALRRAAEEAGFLRHLEDFARGIVDLRHVAYYVTFTLFFLFLTVRSLESRRWR
jgi:ABC-2 type transport system permease protein